MAPWTLVLCLVVLRAEFNAVAPNRDKASDGTVGDPAHAATSSDHNPDETARTPYEDADRRNEVHAVDIDGHLRVPGLTMQDCVRRIVLRHRDGRDNRLQNVIYDGRIWSRSWGWATRTYDGANKHRQHAHFSARYSTAQENDRRPWGLLEFDVTKSQFIAWMTEWARSSAGREALGRAGMGYDPGPGDDGKPRWPGVPDPSRPGQTIAPGTALGTILTTVRSNFSLLSAERAEVPPTPEHIAEAVVVRLAGASSPQEKADVLRAVLGNDAAEVGRLLAG